MHYVNIAVYWQCYLITVRTLPEPQVCRAHVATCCNANVWGTVSIMTKLRDRRPGFDSRPRQWRHFFLFATASRSALRPIHPHI